MQRPEQLTEHAHSEFTVGARGGEEGEGLCEMKLDDREIAGGRCEG